MSTNSSFSTFVRPPGSPVYTPKGPALILPRRGASIRAATLSTPQTREEATAEARRQIAQILALINTGNTTPPMPIPPTIDTQSEELMKSLHQLEMQVAERERVVEEREFRMAERERDLAEGEALLKHHTALLAAAKKTPVARPGLSDEERMALMGLKEELERQEQLLIEGREALREREKFVEESEIRLFEKVQQQQEKETELEQMDEELRQRRAETVQAAGGLQPPPPKKEFDEFNE
ncbi:MAG: hypothetical protein WC205_13790 [Opitutaceae bacterium]|jgi:hypothetical protein